MARPTALTIAGSDSGGGAGIQADLKTFEGFEVFGTSCITALTAQNTLKVLGVHAVPATHVALQIDAVLDDIGADAVKTGMLATAEIVEVVAERLQEHANVNIRNGNIVVDPVMVAKGGHFLLAPDAMEAMRKFLFPLATIVTPNTEEAEALGSPPIRTLDDMCEAARRIFDLGPKAVLIKGGHVEVEPGKAVDVLYDGQRFQEFRAPRHATQHTHGTGCALSAAIAASLAHGKDIDAAVLDAKSWLWNAIAKAFVPGRGEGRGCPDYNINAG
jgi:hydroxymethylpyrimidine/phosphomethylpyrimidine kinase